MADAQDSPLRVLVVEDEWPARNYLVELLHESKLAVVGAAVADAESAQQALEGGLAVDVVFADVHLVGSARDDAGLELVRAFAQKPGAPLFVLATAYKEHAIEAYALGVVDYLLKPFTEERVEQCLRRLLARRQTRVAQSGAPTKIVARKKKGLVFLRPDEVWAFEAADRLTFVHTKRGKFDLDLSLSAIEAAFGGGTLLRAHRNWLVNLAHVRELLREAGDSELLVGDDEGVHVPVARERAQAVRDALLADATGLRRA